MAASKPMGASMRRSRKSQTIKDHRDVSISMEPLNHARGWTALITMGGVERHGEKTKRVSKDITPEAASIVFPSHEKSVFLGVRIFLASPGCWLSLIDRGSQDALMTGRRGTCMKDRKRGWGSYRSWRRGSSSNREGPWRGLTYR